jgi:hypothetical protein
MTGDQLDYEAWRFWMAAVSLLFNGVVGVYVWLSNRDRVTQGRIGQLETDVDTRLDSHETRLTAIETSLSHLPKSDDLQRIERRIGGVKGAVERLNGTTQALERQTALFNEHLLGRDKS